MAQDSLAGQAGIQPVMLQGPSVSNVREPRVPDVRQSAGMQISNALGKWATGKFKAAADVQHERSVLDGQMAQVQGRTFDAVQMEGDKWATDGYRLMDAQVVSSSLLAAQQSAIANGEFALNPDEFRASYVNRLEGAIQGQDPRTAQLVREQMGRQLPTLVGAHTTAYLQNNEETTYASLVRSVDVSSRDDTADAALISFAAGGEGSATAGLSDGRRTAAVVDGIIGAFSNDNPRAFAILSASGALADLTTAQQGSIRAAQTQFEQRARNTYDAGFLQDQQDIIKRVEDGDYESPLQAVEDMAALYADRGISIDMQQAGTIYNSNDNAIRVNDMTRWNNFQAADARGDLSQMAAITDPIIVDIESGGRGGALGPLITSGANAGDRAQGDHQVMPLTSSDPGFGVRPAANTSQAEISRVGKDYWHAMLGGTSTNSALTWEAGDWEAAAIAYNAGPANANAWLASGRDYSTLPDQAQTEDYVNKFRERLTGSRSFTTGDRFNLSVSNLATARDEMQLAAYEQLAPQLTDNRNAFVAGDMPFSAFQAANRDLYDQYDVIRTEADVNRELAAYDSRYDALETAATDNADASNLRTAQNQIAAARIGLDNFLNPPDVNGQAVAPPSVQATQQALADFASYQNDVMEQNWVALRDWNYKGEDQTRWGNLADAISANQAWQDDGARIANAQANGTVGDLPTNLRERMFTEERGKVEKAAQDAVNEGTDINTVAQVASAATLDMYAAAGSVDAETRNQTSAALTGMLQLDGVANPAVAAAYDNYMALRDKNPLAAKSMLTAEAASVVYAIEAIDAGRGNVTAAIEQLSITGEQRTPAEVTAYLQSPEWTAEIDSQIDTIIGANNIGVFQAALSPADWGQVYDGVGAQETRLLSDATASTIREGIAAGASVIARFAPSLNAEAIVAQATSDYMTRTALVSGNPVELAEGMDWNKELWGDNAQEYAGTGRINSAVADYIASPEFANERDANGDFTHPWARQALPSFWGNTVGGAFGVLASTVGLSEGKSYVGPLDVLDGYISGAQPWELHARADGQGVWVNQRTNGGEYIQFPLDLGIAGAWDKARRDRQSRAGSGKLATHFNPLEVLLNPVGILGN